MTVPSPKAGAQEAVARRVLDRIERLTERMGDSYRSHVPEYAALTPEAMADEVLPVSRKIVEEFFRAVIDGDAPDVAGLPELQLMGRRRLEMGVPLEPMLHVYRIAGRTVWDAIVEATPPQEAMVLAPLGAAWMDYIDEASSAAAAAYLEASHERLRAVDARRGALIDAILAATDSAEVAAVATEFSTTFAARYAPVLAAGYDVALRVDAAADAAGPSALAGFHNGHLVVLVPDGEPRLAAVAKAAGRAAVVVWGESSSPGADLLAEYRNAEATLSVAVLAGTPGVHGPDDLVFERLLAGAPRAGATIARHLSAIRAKDRNGSLEATLRAWLASGSVPAVAEAVNAHANTVGYRLRRVTDLTGLDPRVPEQAAVLALALCAVSDPSSGS
ncbi:MAG: PucR family transcriptional regulator [Acidimicrobiales bacterium]